jgi:TIR domain
MSTSGEAFTHDVFISHASEDQEAFVRPLANALAALGYRVWYSEHSLTLGDRLRRSIDQGLRESRFGVVVLSPSFFAKHWPQQELDGLVALEADGSKRILPVWHGVDGDAVARFSPTLADRFAANSDLGFDAVATEIGKAIDQAPRTGAQSEAASRATRKMTVDARLARRNLIDPTSVSFCRNNDADQLFVRANGCTVPCDPRVVLSLVPVGPPQELNYEPLWAIYESLRHSRSGHPLAGTDGRPRGEGLVVRTPRSTDEPLLTRYLTIDGDGYVEWGRALGGCNDVLCVVRLGPLLWAVRYLMDFSAELKEQFDLLCVYELVISISGTANTSLSHLGAGWREPWDRDFEYYRPQCRDEAVQVRYTIPSNLTEEWKRGTILALDKYLNRIWGDRNVRGHEHINRVQADAEGPILSERYRDHDPWE